MRRIRKELDTLEEWVSGRMIDYKIDNNKEILATVWYIPEYGLLGFRHDVTDNIYPDIFTKKELNIPYVTIDMYQLLSKEMDKKVIMGKIHDYGINTKQLEKSHTDFKDRIEWVIDNYPNFLEYYFEPIVKFTLNKESYDINPVIKIYELIEDQYYVLTSNKNNNQNQMIESNEIIKSVEEYINKKYI